MPNTLDNILNYDKVIDALTDMEIIEVELRFKYFIRHVSIDPHAPEPAIDGPLHLLYNVELVKVRLIDMDILGLTKGLREKYKRTLKGCINTGLDNIIRNFKNGVLKSALS